MRTGLCVLVYVVAGVSVYLLGLGKTHEPARYTATAKICQESVRQAEPGVGSPTELPAVDADAVEGQIVSAANLRRALAHLDARPGRVADGDHPAAASEAIEQVREDLRVDVSESSTADHVEISITYAGRDPERVVGLVNSLAEQYADDYHSMLEGAVRQGYRKVHNELETARQELRAARSHLEWFLERHFREHRARAEQSAATVPEPPSADEPVAEPATIDNPEWVELDRRRRELAQHRSELLVHRTPAHPEVRDVELQIARLKQHLAGIPRKIPAPKSDSPTVVHPSAGDPATPLAQRPSVSLGRVLPSEALEEHEEAAQEFLALKQAYDQARQSHDRLAEKEREAWQRRLQTPKLRVQLARGCEMSEPRRGSARLPLVALASGLVLAAGAGMVFVGVGGDQPYHTVAQARRKLPVPVVGTVWAISASQAEAGRRRSPLIGGAALVVYGLILIATCIAILFTYITYTL